jgi:hypothetical protein
VQQEADYAQGFWVGNLRQLGMVGIRDANRILHPIIVAIHKYEDGPGSTNMLLNSTKMVIKSSAVPSTCLKDGSVALRSVSNFLLLIDQDCFANMVQHPFTGGGGVRVSRRSLFRYLLTVNHYDGQTVLPKENTL